MPPNVSLFVCYSYGVVKKNDLCVSGWRSFDRIHVGAWSGGSIIISHLLFADDTMIFSKANLYDLCNLRNLVLCSEVVSGLRISLTKSKLVLVGNVITTERSG
jgi:hypothetical protein